MSLVYYENTEKQTEKNLKACGCSKKSCKKCGKNCKKDKCYHHHEHHHHHHHPCVPPPQPHPCPLPPIPCGVDSVVLNATNIQFYNTDRFLGWQVFTQAPPFATTIPASNVTINSGNRIAIILTGASGSANTIGNTLQSLGVYNQVLLMQNDVNAPIPSSAAFIQTQLAPLLTLKNIWIDIFAISRGSIVARYYFEILGYGSNPFFKNVMLIVNAQEGFRFNSQQISDPLAAVANDIYNAAFGGITLAQAIYGNSVTIAQRLANIYNVPFSYTNKWVDSKLPGVDLITEQLNTTTVSDDIKINLKYYTVNGYIDRGVQTTSQLTALLKLNSIPVSPTVSFNGTISGTTLTINSGTNPTIGMLVTGTGVFAGTVILSGVAPTFTVSTSQSIGPIAMTGVGPNFGNDHPYAWTAQNLINNPSGITDLLIMSYILNWESTMNNLAALFDYAANKYVQLPNSVINENTVQTVSVVTGGNYSTPPTTVTFTAPPLPNGVTATGTVVTDFGVNQATVNAGGTGYTLNDLPTIIVNNAGTTGTNASFAVSTIDPSTGAITGIQIVNAGVGYGSGPPPTLSLSGGTGSGAILTCTIGPVLIGVNITNNGSGYIQTPGATISGGTLLPGATLTGTISANTNVLNVTAVTGTISVGQSISGSGLNSGTTIIGGSGTTFYISYTPTISISGSMTTNGNPATVLVVPLMQNIMDGLESSSAVDYQAPLTEKSNFYKNHAYPARSMIPYSHTAIAGASNSAISAAAQMDPYLYGFYETMIQKYFK